MPIGPRYVGVARLAWYDKNGQVFDYSDARYDFYATYLNSSYKGVKSSCSSPYNPSASLIPTSGTVNSNASFSIRSYPPNTSIGVRWDGTLLCTLETNSSGKAAGTFKIPAAPMGTHKVRFSVGSIAAERTVTVFPRIKVIPSTVSRGQTVNISLRGFKKQETVRIRWKKGSTWVQLSTVVTSKSGSANINIKVPSWVPDGATSVRGDSVNTASGRAQTNAIIVSGGALSPGEAAKTTTPSPTATATSTPSPTATASPSPTVAPTQTPEATATTAPTTPEGTPEPTITETPSPEPTSEATTEAAPSEAIPGDSSG